MNTSPVVATATALLMALAPAQDPPAGVRLVYELPVDALQRTLMDRPEFDLEQLLVRTVETIGARLGRQVHVTRSGATGFTVDVPGKSVERLESMRRRIEAAGTLEFRMLADPDYRAQGCTIDLAAERTRLQEWLVAGGRKRLLADPAAIADYAAANKEQLRWALRRLRPRADKPELWQYSFLQIPGVREAAVAVYSDDDWNKGEVPAARAANEPFLIELVALNLHAGGFTQRDFDPQKVRATKARDGTGAVQFGMVAEQKRAYSDWTERFVGKCSAIVVNGEVVSAPRFVSRIPGNGIIEGHFTTAEARDLTVSLRSGELQVPPRLLRQEALPAKAKHDGIKDNGARRKK